MLGWKFQTEVDVRESAIVEYLPTPNLNPIVKRKLPVIGRACLYTIRNGRKVAALTPKAASTKFAGDAPATREISTFSVFTVSLVFSQLQVGRL